MHSLEILARIALCAVFALAAITKARDPRRLRSGLVEFGVPPALAPLSAGLLIAAELIVAVALLGDRTVSAAGWSAAGLLAIFSLVVGVHLARGHRPVCNCFGAGDQRPIGWETLARNAALIGLGVFVAVRAGEAPLLPALGSAFDAMRSQALVTNLLAAGVALLAILIALVLQIARQQGRLLLRIEALERGDEPVPAIAAAAGLPAGSAAPAFALATIDDEIVTLDELDAAGLPVLLLFVNPHCGPCETLLPEVARWQADYASALTVAIVSEGTVADNRAKAGGLERVLLQREREVAQAYQVYGTPGAVLLDGGRIASPVAQGADEIRTLVAEVFDGRPRRMLGAGDALPDVTIESSTGAAIALRDLVATDEETVLLFWNPQCGFCANMLDDVREWERRRCDGDVRLTILSNAALDAATELQSQVVIDAATRVAAAFGAAGTPMAVRIDPRGVLASGVVAGRDAVLDLLNLEPARA